LAENEKDERFLLEIGRKVLLISAADSFQNATVNIPAAQPFCDKGLSFFPYRSFHATDFCVLVWTGQRLEILPELDGDQFGFICRMQQQAAPKHMVIDMPKMERDLAVAAAHGWKNPLESKGEFSIYWIYEDFTRDYTQRPENEWPCQDVGLALSDLMFSNWNKSQNIRNHGGAISRACSLLKTEMCFFVWARNCLRPLGNIDEDEIDKMKKYLSKEGSYWGQPLI
jgi:hypothetical protein